MVSGILSGVLCILCVVVVPAVRADYCNSYWDEDNDYRDAQMCDTYCCGTCNNRYCCSDRIDRLTQEKQERCSGSFNHKSKNIAVIVGSILGSLIPIILCVTLIICCVAPCCLCYKKCRKRRDERQIAVMTTVHTPPPTVSPTGYQPPYPGYQSVPRYEGPPVPTAPPPSYLESTSPAHPTLLSQGQPMYIRQPSSEPHAALPHLDELVQPPYNPSYGANPWP